MQTGPCGVLVVNKHGGVTSHDIVGKIRRLYGTRAVGHTGTLDPLATGVLVVLIGRAAKAAEYLVSDKKEYRATLRLGLTTDTEDITGEVLTGSSGGGLCHTIDSNYHCQCYQLVSRICNVQLVAVAPGHPFL